MPDGRMVAAGSTAAHTSDMPKEAGAEPKVDRTLVMLEEEGAAAGYCRTAEPNLPGPGTRAC
jgi:hypothetical protein